MGRVRKEDVLKHSASSSTTPAKSSKKRKTNAPVVEEFKFSVKAMINKERTKVLCLEVDSHFADVLLSFLTLPLGTIVRLLKPQPVVTKYSASSPFIVRDKPVPVIGSLNTLWKGLEYLDYVDFWTDEGASMLYEPINPFAEGCRKLKINIDDTEPTKYFTCSDLHCKSDNTPCLSMIDGCSKCDGCGEVMEEELRISNSDTGINNDSGGGGVFTRNAISFLISDDLQIMPNAPGSMIQILNNLGIADISGVELRKTSIGLSEILDLLKGSLFSQTPLTDIILKKECEIESASERSEEVIPPNQMKTNSNKKMIVKAMVQKSTNKLLFLHTEEDFVDFLFSLLTIPLGGVVRLLGGKTSLGCVDNLYRSLKNLDGDKHLKNPGTKEKLLNPMLPPMYRSEHQILPINEQEAPAIYYYPEDGELAELSSHFPEMTEDGETRYGSLMILKDPKGGSSFVKGPAVFLVTDDLTVEPSCMSSTVSLINKLKIPISDVGEMEINIGLEEGLSILKASLTSANALTNGLSSKLKKQAKQEHQG